MSILSLPYLTKTKTGIYGYRRRVPDRIRATVGKTEIVRSFDTADLKALRQRHAAFHAIVERTFANADTGANVGKPWSCGETIRVVQARSQPADERQSRAGANDRASAVAIVLTDVGMQDPTLRPQPTISQALRLKLQDYGRGRDQQREDYVRYARERRRMVVDLIAKIGDKDITTVSRAEARSFLTHLEEDGYSPGSIKKHIAFLNAMFTLGFHEYEHGGTNPWSKLKIVAPEADDENGVSFEYAEVRTLLAKVASINNDLRDIIRLLACTGARLGEISGLEIGDVNLERGAISLRFNAIRRLKNKESIRVVPIVDAQSLDALSGRLSLYRNGGRQAPLFPRYGRPNGSGSASAALGKWLTTIKLRDPHADKPKTTHSLRHTFKDALRELGISRDIANKIQGHTVGDVASSYGSSDLMEAKRKATAQAWLLIAGESSG